MKERLPPRMGDTELENSFYKDLWFETFGYPMGWSEWLSEHTFGNLQELHKKRLESFKQQMTGKPQPNAK